jgi:hypothetical protein
MKHELFEELEAFDPRYREHYATVRGAAIAAGVHDLYLAWRKTPEGAACASITQDVPDYAGAIKTAQEAAERLPFNLGDV